MSEIETLECSQRELSKTLGITPQFLNNVLRGQAIAPLNWCPVLSDVFGENIDYLEKIWLDDYKQFMHRKEKVSKSKRSSRQRASKLMERLQKLNLHSTPTLRVKG